MVKFRESNFLLLLSYLDLQSLTQRRKHLCEDNLLVPHRVSCGLLSGRATLRNKARLLNEDKQRNDRHVGPACLIIYLYTSQIWLIMSTKINHLNRSPQYKPSASFVPGNGRCCSCNVTVIQSIMSNQKPCYPQPGPGGHHSALLPNWHGGHSHYCSEELRKSIFPINHQNKSDVCKTVDRTLRTANKIDYDSVRNI